jgi:signal transduction histidine kinase
VENQTGTPAGNGESRGVGPLDAPDLSIPQTVSNSAGEAHALERLRRQLNHDIQQQLGTIMMLASVIGSADDVGIASRIRSEQILGEARWMRRLLRAYDAVREPTDPAAQPRPVSVDRIAAEVVAALRLSGPTRVTLRADQAWADVEELGLWRALRNVVDNAFRAAGGQGTVEVKVRVADGWTVTQVDDDGPGFGAGPPGLASLGLGIVQDFTTGSGGALQIGRSTLGGSRVQIWLPAASPPKPGPGWG